MRKKYVLFLCSLFTTIVSYGQTIAQEVPSLANSEPIGQTEGKVEVSDTGAVVYSIPIQVPKGVDGIEPKIGLTYNSQSNATTIGQGWSISGLSSISRIPSTLYHDGKVDAVNYSSSDRFALDGQRLLLKSGTYGGDGAEYQTENYSNVKITSHGVSPYGANYGPKYFKVVYPDGSIATYGNSDNSRSKLEFAITNINNSSGIGLSYTYITKGNMLLISSIKYVSSLNDLVIQKPAPTDPILVPVVKLGDKELQKVDKNISDLKDINTGLVFSRYWNEINFIYKETNNRIHTYYVGGEKFESQAYLSQIETKSEGKVYRNYELNFTTDHFGRNLLRSIKEFNGADTQELIPINIRYIQDDKSDIEMAFRQTLPTNLSGDVTSNYFSSITGDFDGDGILDYIIYNKNNGENWLYYSTAGEEGQNIHNNTGHITFATMFPVQLKNTNNEILPYEGWAEIFRGTVHVRSFSNGVVKHEFSKQYELPKFKIAPSPNNCDMGVDQDLPNEYFSGDFNGDGLTDIIAIQKPTTVMLPRCSTRPPIEELPMEMIDVRGGEVYLLDLYSNSTVADYKGFISNYQNNTKVLTGNFLGSMKTDLLVINEGKMIVYSYNGTSMANIFEYSDLNVRLDSQVHLGDFNGDGKLDIMFTSDENGTYVLYSTGKGFDKKVLNDNVKMYDRYDESALKEHYYVEYKNVIATDFNNDGKTDFIEFTYVVRPKEIKLKNLPTLPKSGAVSSISFIKNMGDGTFQKINSISLNYLGNFDRIYSSSDNIQYIPIPIYLSPQSKVAYTPNSFLMGLFVNQKMYSFEYKYNHMEGKLINFINEGGSSTQFRYGQYGIKPSSSEGQGDFLHFMKYSNTKEKYPIVELNTLPNIYLVKEIYVKSNDGIKLKQSFSYASPVVNLYGVGFLGFKGTVRTNLYDKPENMFKNIKEFDVLNRGLLKKESVATGNQWDSFIPPSSPIARLQSFESVVNYEYQTEFLSNKVFKPRLTKLIEKNYGGFSAMLGRNYFEKETINTYNQYNDVIKQQIQYKEMFGLVMVGQPSFALHKTEIIENTYAYGAENPNYFMSRLLKSKKTQTITGEAGFSTEESYAYDEKGRVIEVLKKGNNTAETLTEKNVYDQYGNIVEKSIKAGNLPERKQKYKYGFSGRFLTEETNIDGLKTSFTYNSSRGLITEETNAFGQSTKHAYNNWGQPISIIDYLGNETKISYLKTSSGFEIITTDKMNSWKKELFDKKGNKIQSSIKNITGSIVSKSFVYDAYNRLIKESENYFGNTPSLWNETTYDKKGRVSKLKTSKGKEITTSYSVTTTTVNDGVSTKETKINAAGDVVSRKDAGGEIKYVYFSNGNLKSATYDGVVVSLEQDGWGRKTKLTDPSAGTYTYAYNAFGELIKEESPKGTTLFTLDSFGKQSKKKITGDQTNTEITYNYREDTKQLASSTAIINGTHYNYNYLYDAYHRLSKTTEVTPVATFTKQLTYDDFGRPLEEKLTVTSHGKSSEKKIKNLYKNGYRWQVVDALTNKVLITTENTNEYEQVTQSKLGNGLEINYGYDVYGYLKSNTVKKGATGLFTLTNQFDSQRGNLLSRTNGLFNRTETFTYDNLDRLASFTNKKGVQEIQVYDTKGRITSNNVGDYNYTGVASYQLASIDLELAAQSYYQLRPEQKILYNIFKNPVWIKEDGKENIYFDYNSHNQRSVMYYGDLATSKEQSPFRRYYSTDGNIEVNYNKITNKVDFVFYLDGDAYSATVIAKGENTPEYYYLHRDYLGSILAITNTTGNIVEKRHFDAWGNLVFVKDGQNNDLGKLTLLERGYTGHEHLQGAVLIHMNGRLYDPTIRRFLAPDNFIQDPNNTQNFNRYSYVLNNPLVYVDENGEFWITAVGALIGAYMGASMHQGSYNPGDWGSDWWKGAVVGGVIGAYGGQSLAGVVGVGGISGHTLFAQTLMAAGEGMVQSYVGGIMSFDADKGFTLNLGLNKDRMNTMLIAGMIKGANKMIDMGAQKALFDGYATVWDASIVKMASKDIVSNVIKGEPAFKRVSFLKFGNGIIDIGIGRKMFDIDKLGSHLGTHAQGWGMFGAANMLGGGGTPHFNYFDLSFNYKRNSKYIGGVFTNWWKDMNTTDKVAAAGMGATFVGIVSTVGVNIRF